MMKKYDAIIIGFGKGGKTLAASLAKQNKKVALIEKSDKMYGGTCINVGCIPTKSLVNSAKRVHSMGNLSIEEKKEAYRRAVEEKERLTAMLRKKNFDKLNDNPNIDVILGTASFLSPQTVTVSLSNGENMEIEAEQFFINTGAAAFIPPIKGLRESRFSYVSETLLDLKELPQRLVIIGGGYIGLEFASFYTNFGAKVTVIQDGEVFLPREDDDVAQEMKKIFENRGVSFLLGTNTYEVEDKENSAVLYYEKGGVKGQLEADAILIATGRRPNTAELHPEKAGVAVTPRGAIETDEYLKTTAPHIWAMGDVAGSPMFTYISLDDYRIVNGQLTGADSGYNTAVRSNVPNSVFIEPPFSRVGLNEREAREKGYDITVSKLMVAAIPKSQVLRETDGLLKAVIDNKTERILGVMLLCPESHEMINTVKLAIDAGLSYRILRDQVFTHPTMSESFNDLFSI